MVEVSDVLAATSIEDARAKLLAAFTDEPAFDTEFAWASEALKKTTAQVVDNLLGDTYPPLSWPRPNRISENIAEAGNVLEQCVARQDRLFELESACITAVIDSMSAKQAIGHDETMDVAAASANAIAAKLLVEEAVSAARGKAALRRDALRFRTNFYSVPGGALNFNERIALLRDLQAQGVRDVLERLRALRTGLAITGIAKLAPVPDWIANGQPLTALVQWLRRAARAIAKAGAAERSITLSISSAKEPGLFRTLAGHPLPANLADISDSKGVIAINLDFNAATLQRFCSDVTPKSARVQSVALGLIFGGNEEGPGLLNSDDPTRAGFAHTRDAYLRRWRAQKRLAVRAMAPEQKATFDDGTTVGWTPPEIRLGERGVATETVDAADMCMLPVEHFTSIHPSGRWQLSVINTLRDPHGSMSFVAGADDRPPEMSWAHLQFMGFVLTFNLIVQV